VTAESWLREVLAEAGLTLRDFASEHPVERRKLDILEATPRPSDSPAPPESGAAAS
jgi:hypothetical protein